MNDDDVVGNPFKGIMWGLAISIPLWFIFGAIVWSLS